MNFVDISIRRPTFITCLVLVMLAVGYFSMNKLGVDLFPNITFPIVTVSTPYPGAGPSEIETLVSKIIEDEVSSISGMKRLTSINQEGVSTVVAEFNDGVDVKYAEQQIRDRVSAAKRKLPTDTKESVIRRIDPGDQASILISVEADLPEDQLYDIADEIIRPKLEQINQVGLVDITGGRKREIQIVLDRNKLKAHELSATQVSNRLASAGENIPVGKVTGNKTEVVFRSIGEFKTIADIRSRIVNFFGSDVPVTVNDIGIVQEGVTDEISRAYVNGKKSLIISVFRQSGSNTIAVVDRILATVNLLNKNLENTKGKPKLTVIRDGSMWIRANVDDVKESIFIGIVLAIIVVYFFLANGRSTFITGMALPNSLIGAFILMAAAGFTINIMTLLALSLSIGLLIDDAIVVRENIFRHIEMGKKPALAARVGTLEVQLAVIATTFTVLAVFGPVGFLSGVVGQFFKEFGLTICFVMLISLFDALTVAPMLSAYFAGETQAKKENLWRKTVGRAVGKFSDFQDWLEIKYEKVLNFSQKKPLTILISSFLILLVSCSTVAFVPKTFLPQQDSGEFEVAIDLPPGTSLDETNKVASAIDEIIRSNPEVEISSLTVGDKDAQSHVASFYIRLVKAKLRKKNTTEMKDIVREQLTTFSYANPIVKDFDPVAVGLRPFALNIIGNNQKELEEYSQKAFAILKKNPGLKDVEINFKPGKPELQVEIDNLRADKLGVSHAQVGMELRAQIEGTTPAKFREFGREYDVRVRLQEDQRNLQENFDKTFVPNINFNLVRLKDIATPVNASGPAKIYRVDRSRFIRISADIAPGAGLGDLMKETEVVLKNEVKLPPDMRYQFIGQGENFQELADGVKTAIGFGILFIFLILASLYESFVTPLTIMLALPLAICGSLVALFIFQESLNIFSMIGCIMLLGVATKNSILLVDYANQLVREGMDRVSAMTKAGKTRLRPILMTTMALIAGTTPVAMGLNEASKQRTSMGIAIIGGLISSTLLTLIVVPAAYSYIDRFRIWSKTKLATLVGAQKLEKGDLEA